MIRTIIAALLGVSALGVVSANATTLGVDKSDIRSLVEQKAPSLDLSRSNIDSIYVVPNRNGDGDRIQGYTAYVDRYDGMTKVVVFDDKGSVKRTYFR